MGFFFIIHCFLCVLLILVILFQDGKTGGLVSVADNSSSLFGAQGATSFLTKFTSAIAILFMVSSMFLAYRNSPDNQGIASGFTPTTQAPVESTVVPSNGNSGDAGSSTVLPEGIQAIDAEGNPINLKEAITNQEVITDPSQLPPDLREAEMQRIKEETEKAKKRAQEASEGNDP
ncbi:preprotein translocase subunit SecG [Sulfidibacter corallicola]|uniref:Protein-export membrane protein SecG n=1 Tax=Sulfidibacter corallicola TaxID=2818388 RepID=A0A8A4TM80_SULCO|nr:preprotein translocase subunit SecG [Sulfidibacter corallicola]QTD47705.1 preprotein translocase subunit SecG [Sulfidibacter corallicola]